MALIRFALAAQLVVLSSACFGADKPVNLDARGVAPSAFYVGVQGGMAWAQDKMSQYSGVTTAFGFNMSSNAAFGGLHVGYQRLLDNYLVAVEADYDHGGQKGAGTFVDTTKSYTRTYQMDYRSTLRAKFGYDFGALSVYATGGGAITNLKTTASSSSTSYIVSADSFGFGATVGAGVTYKLGRNWSAFSEYRYADFGTASVASDISSVRPKASHRVTETSVRAGATYYFR